MSIDEAHATLLKDHRLQFDLPDASARRPVPETWLFHRAWDGSVLEWAIVAIAAVLTLAIVWHVWRTRSVEPVVSSSPEDHAVIRASVARATLAVADGLAFQGRFAEAAQALLACGVDEIGRRYPTLLRPATTARDITRLDGLPGIIRTPFTRIAVIVELGIFGNRPVGGGDYADCRQAFVTSALAGRS